MRLTALHCLLLACIATSIASEEPRPKRDLAYLKDLIATRLFSSSRHNCSKSFPEASLIRDDDSVKLFRIPGHDHILVRAVPKINVIEAVAPIPEKVVEVNPTIGVLESYLGTKSSGETLNALQGVKNLLQSGILNYKQQGIEVVPAGNPVYFAPYLSEAIEIAQRRPVAVTPIPPKVPLIPVLPPSVNAPAQVLPELIPIRPIKVPQMIHIPVMPTLHDYSYKLLKNDGSVMGYYARNGGDVIVTETNKPMPAPPQYIIDRFQNIFFGQPLGTRPIPVRPPLTPISSVVAPKPENFNVPFSPVIMPPIQTVLETPRIEVNGNPDLYQPPYATPVAAREPFPPVIMQEPMFMPAPPTYIIERIAKGVTIPKPPKTPPGYSIKVVHNGGINKDRMSSTGNLPYRNSVLFAETLAPKYVYKQTHAHLPNNLATMNMENKSTLNTKGKVSGHPQPCDTPKVNAPPALSTYSYNQINNGGKLTSYSTAQAVKSNNAAIIVKESVQMLPAPPLHVVQRIENAAATAHAALPLKLNTSGYSFQLTQNGAHLSQPVTGTEERKQGVNLSGTSKYPHKQEGNSERLATYEGLVRGSNRATPILATKTNNEISTPPQQIVTNFEKETAMGQDAFGSPKSSTGYSYKVINGGIQQPELSKGDTIDLQRPAVIGQTVSSSYTYKQINSNSQQPFTIVPVGNTPVVNITGKRVNTQQNYIQYPQNGQVPPSEYVYMPPVTAVEVPLSIQHQQNEKANNRAQFSYKQVTNQGGNNNKDGSVHFKDVLLQTSTESPKVYTTDKQTTIAAAAGLLSSNPIIVPDKQIFSYKQNKLDGSSINVVANNENTVSVEVSESEKKKINNENFRGDIPDAFE